MTIIIMMIGAGALAKSVKTHDWLAGAASICLVFIGYSVMLARIAKGAAL